MSIRICSFILVITFLIQTIASAAETGVMLSYPLQSKDPSDLHGYKGSLWYQPTPFQWGNSHLLFDASVGHWWVNNYPTNRELNIVALAPVYRFFMLNDH